MKGVEARIVDHMGLGRVIRIESDAPERDWEAIEALGSVQRVAGALEGKIELGLFVKEERPEFTESLRQIIERAGGR